MIAYNPLFLILFYSIESEVRSLQLHLLKCSIPADVIALFPNLYTPITYLKFVQFRPITRTKYLQSSIFDIIVSQDNRSQLRPTCIDDVANPFRTYCIAL